MHVVTLSLLPAVWGGSLVASLGCLVMVLAGHGRLQATPLRRWGFLTWLALFVAFQLLVLDRVVRADAGPLALTAAGVAMLNLVSSLFCYVWFWVARSAGRSSL